MLQAGVAGQPRSFSQVDHRRGDLPTSSVSADCLQNRHVGRLQLTRVAGSVCFEPGHEPPSGGLAEAGMTTGTSLRAKPATRKDGFAWSATGRRRSDVPLPRSHRAWRQRILAASALHRGCAGRPTGVGSGTARTWWPALPFGGDPAACLDGWRPVLAGPSLSAEERRGGLGAFACLSPGQRRPGLRRSQPQAPRGERSSRRSCP